MVLSPSSIPSFRVQRIRTSSSSSHNAQVSHMRMPVSTVDTNRRTLRRAPCGTLSAVVLSSAPRGQSSLSRFDCPILIDDSVGPDCVCLLLICPPLYPSFHCRCHVGRHVCAIKKQKEEKIDKKTKPRLQTAFITMHHNAHSAHRTFFCLLRTLRWWIHWEGQARPVQSGPGFEAGQPDPVSRSRTTYVLRTS